MKVNFISIAISAALIGLVSCNQSNSNKKNENKGAANYQPNVVAAYVAHLQPLNSKVTGMNTTAEAKFIVTKDSIFVTISADGVPPNMQHWQHFHGFKNNADATVATQADDKNKDGIVDVVETEVTSGTTMVPFNANPEDMNLGSNTYPKAGSDSAYHYEAKIPLAKLKAAFFKSFGDSSLDLDKRVLYIHGVPSDTKLPSTVASVENIPASVTLPIACGKIEKISGNN